MQRMHPHVVCHAEQRHVTHTPGTRVFWSPAAEATPELCWVLHLHSHETMRQCVCEPWVLRQEAPARFQHNPKSE